MTWMCRNIAPGHIAACVPPPKAPGEVYKTPWCHLPKGHEGPHRCGDFQWVNEHTQKAEEADVSDVCWHCKDVLAPQGRPRCERCPEECDVEGCTEPGCEATRYDGLCQDGHTHTFEKGDQMAALYPGFHHGTKHCNDGVSPRPQERATGGSTRLSLSEEMQRRANQITAHLQADGHCLHDFADRVAELEREQGRLQRELDDIHQWLTEAGVGSKDEPLLARVSLSFDMAAPGQEVLKLCRAFIKEQGITCSETIFQCDWVGEHALTFIDRVAAVVGYEVEED